MIGPEMESCTQCRIPRGATILAKRGIPEGHSQSLRLRDLLTTDAEPGRAGLVKRWLFGSPRC